MFLFVCLVRIVGVDSRKVVLVEMVMRYIVVSRMSVGLCSIVKFLFDCGLMFGGCVLSVVCRLECFFCES